MRSRGTRGVLEMVLDLPEIGGHHDVVVLRGRADLADRAACLDAQRVDGRAELDVDAERAEVVGPRLDHALRPRLVADFALVRLGVGEKVQLHELEHVPKVAVTAAAAAAASTARTCTGTL